MWQVGRRQKKNKEQHDNNCNNGAERRSDGGRQYDDDGFAVTPALRALQRETGHERSKPSAERLLQVKDAWKGRMWGPYGWVLALNKQCRFVDT